MTGGTGLTGATGSTGLSFCSSLSPFAIPARKVDFVPCAFPLQFGTSQLTLYSSHNIALPSVNAGLTGETGLSGGTGNSGHFIILPSSAHDMYIYPMCEGFA